MVVAQVVERSLPTTEICGSNPDITNFISIDFIKSVLKKQKKTKEQSGHDWYIKNYSVS